jgi:hypothetical protein
MDSEEIQEMISNVEILSTRNDQLVSSVADLWAFVGKSSLDQQTRTLCAERIEALNVLSSSSLSESATVYVTDMAEDFPVNVYGTIAF